MKIDITTDHPDSSFGSPVCVINGKVVDDVVGLRACMSAAKLTPRQLAELCGKHARTIDAYLYRGIPVPAAVWLVLKNKLQS